MLGRGINAAITSGTVALVAYGASVIVRRQRALWAIAVAALAAPMSPLIRVGGSVYNDNLAALFSAALIALAVVVLRRGVTRRIVLLSALMAVAAMLTRASGAPALGVLLLALFVQPLASDGVTPRRILRSAGPPAAVLVAAVVGAGWFYYRNQRLTGSFTGGHPDWGIENLGRVARPAGDVVSDWTFWRSLSQLYGYLPGSATDAASWIFTVLMIAGLVAAGWRLIRRGSRVDYLVAAALGLCLLLTIGTQIAHAAEGGGIQTRYLLPALLPLLALPASAVLAWLPAGRWVFAGIVAAAWAAFFNYLGGYRPGWLGGETLNSLPNLAVTCLVVVVVAGAVTSVTALIVLSRRGTAVER
jgi:hypothetical protein